MLCLSQRVAQAATLTFVIVLGLSRAASASPAYIDQVILGNEKSEAAHALASECSEVIQGGLDEPARRLLPLVEPTFDGGWLAVTMQVDPQKENYFTVKLWGSDRGMEKGRLILYANGLQVGYRHEGDHDVLNQCDAEGQAPGRFVYQTVPLPLSLTRGRSTITLKIAALGRMWPYGQTFEQYQKVLAEPSRGIYRLYTHTDNRFEPDSSEKQGQFPEASVRPGPGEEVIAQSKQIVIDRVKKLLQKPIVGDTNRRSRDSRMELLAEAYHVAWTPAFQNPAAIEQLLADGDVSAIEFTRTQTRGNEMAQSWLGAGPLGAVVMKVWPAIEKRMDDVITVGEQQVPRRVPWSNALHQSVEYWRTHRRSYTNQSMIVDTNIYTANRGLQLLDSRRALPEAQARRYLYEAIGIEPWLGSDPSDDREGLADVPGKGTPKCFGESYHLVTRKGLGRELGWVGTYGETILRFTHDMVKLTGDEKIRQQLNKLERARFFFRYPAVDGDGYRCMKLVSEVDNRTAHYPLTGAAYNAPNIGEAWWMDIPAMLSDDPVVVGVAQQCLQDNQYFNYVQGRLKHPDTVGMMFNVDQYEKVKSLPPSEHRLPMIEGQPDFVFADEQNAIVAIKHGQTRLWVNLYYRAERAVNNVARVYEQTPTITRLATVRTQTQVESSGHTYTRPDWIDGIRSRGLPPPGQQIHQAWAGEEMIVAARPADAPSPDPMKEEWGPFLGKASLYQLRYGDFLIVMNSSETRDFPLEFPTEFASSRDLVSGKLACELAGKPIAKLSTIVLCLSAK